MVPVKDLKFVAVAVTEDEKAVAEKVEVKVLADDGGERIDGFAHVCEAGGEVNGGGVEGVQHRAVPSASTIARNREGSKPA